MNDLGSTEATLLHIIFVSHLDGDAWLFVVVPDKEKRRSVFVALMQDVDFWELICQCNLRMS